MLLNIFKLETSGQSCVYQVVPRGANRVVSSSIGPTKTIDQTFISDENDGEGKDAENTSTPFTGKKIKEWENKNATKNAFDFRERISD